MSINKHNAEGYVDPTAHQALTAISWNSVRPAFRPICTSAPRMLEMWKLTRRQPALMPPCVETGTFPSAAPAVSQFFQFETTRPERAPTAFLETP
jgi:hypothetical protein